ncbi:MAG: ATP-dependent RNA helicase HrpA [Gammaproteobacteria bacterium]|nr:ATP-dependent RNA helicase HrpA [Gammaproteobacteria bacterium]
MSFSIKTLREALDSVMLADRRGLRSQCDRLAQRQRNGEDIEKALGDLAARIEASRVTRERRAAARPAIVFPEDLPISGHVEEIQRLLAAHQVVIVCGETGSGKTTQLPKICLALGQGAGGVIGHTQPRRIAARSVAARIAEELGGETGGLVGYKVRFNDRTQADTQVKLMTDGILLAEIQRNRLLDAYDTLIIDEAHERSLNIDFLLGYLSWLLPRRRDLKVIITSATIDTETFSRHFGGAPVVEVSGRGYPVEIRYRPPAEDDGDEGPAEHLAREVGELLHEGPGDILVFLSGEREIREATDALNHHAHPHTEILPLFSRLSVQDQQKIFAPHRGRRVVLATNVAETSLTVPGIRYVVDTGLARISRYSHRSKVQRLPIEPVSQASAKQRAGRCGRVGPGICVRLYREDDLLGRPEQTVPEIQRTNLASVILQMAELGLAHIEAFPFIDPPDSRYINDGYRLLSELGALDGKRRLTPLGRQLSKLMVDPRLGRMLLAGAHGGCLSEVLVIISALSVQDPRDRPAGAEQAADQKHRLFADETSDFLSFLKLWHALDEVFQHQSRRKQHQYCREHFLSWFRVREWRDTHRQLHQTLSQMGFKENAQPADPAEVHKALLTGLLGQVARHKEEAEYLGARGIKLAIFPGSALARKRPRWIMAGLLLETRRLYAHTVARIEPEWIEAVASPDLISRHYFEPHWEKRRGEVVAFEQTSLFGLILHARRKVAYARIDPEVSRRIFLLALAEGEVAGRLDFLTWNTELLAQVTGVEEKTRRRGLVLDVEAIADLYADRVPDDIVDQRSLQAWLKKAKEAERKRMLFSEADLRGETEADTDAADFPDALQIGPLKLPLSYRFEPGEPEDGVTLTVPLMAVDQVDPARLEWLVPGLLEDKVIALIKSLPKTLRRNFVPARDFAVAACTRLAGMSEKDRPASLSEALALALKGMTGVDVPSSAWAPDSLPDHLRMHVSVIDGEGKIVATGRDLTSLRERLGGRIEAAVQAMPTPDIERTDVRDWAKDLPAGGIPAELELDQMGIRVSVFPALVEEGRKVSLRLVDNPDKAARAHADGVLRLFLMREKDVLRGLWNKLSDRQALELLYRTLGASGDLQDDLQRAAGRMALESLAPPRDASGFERFAAHGHERLEAAFETYAGLLKELMAPYREIRDRMKRAQSPALLKVKSDIRGQLDLLLFPGFLAAIDRDRLRHYPRYLKAVAVRLERLVAEPDKDRRRMLEIQPLWETAQKRWPDALAAARDPVRWQFEELRVSLFAQHLKTPEPISAERIKAAMKAS